MVDNLLDSGIEHFKGKKLFVSIWDLLITGSVGFGIKEGWITGSVDFGIKEGWTVVTL